MADEKIGVPSEWHYGIVGELLQSQRPFAYKSSASAVCQFREDGSELLLFCRTLLFQPLFSFKILEDLHSVIESV